MIPSVRPKDKKSWVSLIFRYFQFKWKMNHAFVSDFIVDSVLPNGQQVVIESFYRTHVNTNKLSSVRLRLLATFLLVQHQAQSWIQNSESLLVQ